MRLLRQGMSGSDVAEVQTRLQSWGYPVTIDGVFGPMTTKAVIQFQTARGLKPDGVVGPITYNELQKSPPSPGTIPYIIKPGDTFYELAQTYGIPLASLIAANPRVDPNQLYIGQQILIPQQTTRKRSIAGWIPYWLQDEAFAVIQRNADLFTAISPFWYELTLQGDLAVLPNAEDPKIISFAKNHGIEIIPLIANSYLSQPISTILNDPTLRRKHIQTIVNKVSQMGYNGIEIDYENLLVKDKEVFVVFLRELKAALGINKKVVATLMAKTNSGSSSGAVAHDYYGIGQVVDTVRIMAYDFSWTTPGPIAPANWVKQVFTYAVTLIPPAKLEAGLPTYGYNWGTQRVAISYRDAMNTAKMYNAEIIEDPQNGPHYNYTYTTGTPHEVWFTNALNFKTLMEITKQLNLRGISLWHPGNDDPAIYDLLRNS